MRKRWLKKKKRRKNHTRNKVSKPSYTKGEMIFFCLVILRFVVYLGTNRHKKFTFFLYSLSWLAHPVARDLLRFFLLCCFGRPCVSPLHTKCLPSLASLWQTLTWNRCYLFAFDSLGARLWIRRSCVCCVLLLLPFLVRARLISVDFFLSRSSSSVCTYTEATKNTFSFGKYSSAVHSYLHLSMCFRFTDFARKTQKMERKAREKRMHGIVRVE